MRPGIYATEINIHNYHERDVKIVKRVIPLVLVGAVRGREPEVSSATTTDKIMLPAHTATMDDCCQIMKLVLGGQPTTPVPLTMGLLELVTPVELDVTATYTVTNANNGSTSIDVQTVEAKRAK